MGGFEFQFGAHRGVVTVSSAPNYCGEFGNKGSVLRVNPRLMCSFTVLEPVDWEEEEKSREHPRERSSRDT
jgi:serine/threonine-protein phosphatase PP1 catalytic subunit